MQPRLTALNTLGVSPFGTSGRFFALRLSHPGWPAWNPGQFLMLRPVSFGLEIPWGRPMSICHLSARQLVCFFKVEGRGTERLARLRPGDTVMAWGPLGTSFAMQEDTPTLLLAGGMGIAPFVGYVNRHPQPWNVHMIFGHRDPVCCYPLDSIHERITVDSLQENEPGDLDNLIYTIQERIQEYADMSGLVLACGPTPFLQTVKNLAASACCRLQISLESKMACGLGACLGCACRPKGQLAATHNAPLQICLHGPVFWADEIEIPQTGN